MNPSLATSITMYTLDTMQSNIVFHWAQRTSGTRWPCVWRSIIMGCFQYKKSNCGENGRKRYIFYFTRKMRFYQHEISHSENSKWYYLVKLNEIYYANKTTIFIFNEGPGSELAYFVLIDRCYQPNNNTLLVSLFQVAIYFSIKVKQKLEFLLAITFRHIHVGVWWSERASVMRILSGSCDCLPS